MGLYFFRISIKPGSRGPNRDRAHGSIVHHEGYSSIDEQTRIFVDELVFVRAKFISEGVEFRVFTPGNSVVSCFLKAEEKSFSGGGAYAIQDHISIPS